MCHMRWSFRFYSDTGGACGPLHLKTEEDLSIPLLHKTPAIIKGLRCQPAHVPRWPLKHFKIRVRAIKLMCIKKLVAASTQPCSPTQLYMARDVHQCSPTVRLRSRPVSATKNRTTPPTVISPPLPLVPECLEAGPHLGSIPLSSHH